MIVLLSRYPQVLGLSMMNQLHYVLFGIQKAPKYIVRKSKEGCCYVTHNMLLKKALCTIHHWRTTLLKLIEHRKILNLPQCGNYTVSWFFKNSVKSTFLLIWQIIFTACKIINQFHRISRNIFHDSKIPDFPHCAASWKH